MTCFKLLSYIILKIALFTYEARSLEKEYIMGGDEVDRNDFMYQVSVQNDNYPRCGGGILNEKLVLTAGNCFINESSGVLLRMHFTVLVANNVFLPDENSLRFEISKLYMLIPYLDASQRFVPTYFTPGDIAILELKDGFNMSVNLHIRSINLPKSFSQSRKTFTIAGYGFYTTIIERDLNTNQVVTYRYADGKLRASRVRIITTNDCRDLHGVSIHNSKFCAAVEQRLNERARGVCSGDGGSPFTYKNEILYGVLVSGTINCNETLQPGFYTRVTYYREFIQHVLDNVPYPLTRAFALIKDYEYRFVDVAQ